MKCPACGVENPEGAKVCTACGKDMAAAPAASAPAPAAPAAAKPKRRRYHWFAVIGLIMAAVVPTMRVWRDAAGGPLAAMLAKMMGGGGANAAASAKVDYTASTTAMDYLQKGENAFLAIGIIVGVIAVYQLLSRKTGVGTVLGLGALVLSAAVPMAESYGDALPAGLSARLGTMGRDTGNYHWQTTVVVLLAAIIIECVVGLARPKRAR